MKNRQWVLASRPVGSLKECNFRLQEVDLGAVQLQPGQVLVRNLVFSMAPTMRNRLNEPGRSYLSSVGVGEVIRGPAVFEVIQSNDARFPVGARLMGGSQWEEFSVLNPGQQPTLTIKVPDGMSATEAVGICGLNSLTAYVGVLRVCEPKPGETLVVSGAAGSVGAVAAQIGKILGCRVIGIAGGSAKCGWLLDECGIDAAIDYKSEDVGARLTSLCPHGVNMFFDNVGGNILQAVVDNIAHGARIAVCGQISAYDRDSTAAGPRDMMKIVYWNVKIQGFLLRDYPAEIENGQRDLMRWVAEGKLKHREDVRRGFEYLPTTLMDIFKGGNRGTLMLKP